ncbi:UNVERIFIED_CONTAM: hypothetical protein Slati_3509600 [Sesamum latifolium]|uniref:Uncharacterized protein n=1 Tax=Sesamum latifolium TaxID=2727402 RepID=A0AAW2UK82_9LAMI
MIKSVLMAMPTHLLAVLKPPTGVISRIERMLNKFFWGSSGTIKKLHWSSWHKLYFPVDEGGLGMQSLDDISSAFSLKLWWRFRTISSLWAHFLAEKYCKRSCQASSYSTGSP